jgi:hypothetical protein
MSEIARVRWFQGLPSRVSRTERDERAGGAAELPGAGDPRHDASTRQEDVLELSSRGRRLQVEARVREAVVGELRRLAHRQNPPPERE